MAGAASRLVGREHVQAELDSSLARARDGAGDLVLLVGEPGIGKSALLGWLADRARAEFSVLRGVCWQGAGVPPYWPWAQVLEALDPPLALLGDAAPLLSVGTDPADDLGDRADPDARFRLMEAVRRCLVDRAGSRPVLVLLDDLQWADEPSLTLLSFLARTTSAEPVVLVGARREDETTAALAALDAAARTLPLGGLSREAVELLVGALPGPRPGDAQLAEVWRRSGGNPFFVAELTRLLHAHADGAPPGLPAGVLEVVRRRLARLPTACVRLLEWAALAGPELDLELLGAAGALADGSVTEELLRRAVDAGILTATTPARFAHELYRDAIREGIAANAAVALHLALGHALQDLNRPDGAARIAAHLWEAGPAAHELAALASLEAARQATRRLGHDDAVRHYERALTAIPDARRAELLLELARSLDRAGRFPSARLRYLDAADLARRTGDTTALAVAALGLHALGARSGASVREVVALLEEADAQLGDAHPALHSRVLAARARAGHHAATASADPELTAIAARAVRLAEASADPAALAVARLAEHDVAWARGTAEVRLPIATGMLAAARAADDPELVAQGHLLRATALLELGDPAGRDALLTYVAHAEQLGSARGRWGALTRRATYAQLAGRVEEAVRLGEDALALGRAAGEPDAVGCFCTQRWSLVALGVREPDEPMLADEVDPLWPMVPLMRAWPHAARGDREGARAALGNFSVLDILPTHDLEGLAVAAVVFAVAGDDSQRCWAYEQLAPYAGTHVVVGGCAAYHAAVDHHLGVLAAARGDDALAERHLRAALTMHRRIGAAAWASVTERELDALGARRPVDEFRRVDDRWLLVFGGRACTMADAKGLGDLHRILAADGAEIHVLDLLGPEVRGRVGPTGADPVLDARARAEYRRRLDVLADEVAHAEAAGDAERSDRAERERHALLHELAAATGLGGRDRRLGDATERARKTVGARIRDTLARMEQVHPELAAHLRSAVHLGTTCRYAPPEPVDWRLGG